MRAIDIANSLLLGAGAIGLGGYIYQDLAPNTPIDILTAKYYSCSRDTKPNPSPRIIKWYTGSTKLDDTLKEMKTGDTIKMGEIELLAVDSRRQELYFAPNPKGDLTIARLSCPGYVKFDVYHKGEIVPGGQGVEIVYAKNASTGWPNFSIRDVLSYTDLTEEYMNRVVIESESIEGDKLAKEQRKLREINAVRDQIIGAHERALTLNPNLEKKVSQCRHEYPKTGKDTCYRVKPGDIKRKILKKP